MRRIAVVATVAMTVLLAGCTGTLSPPTTTKPVNEKVISFIHSIAMPHSDPTTAATDVVNLEMFTSRSGVAVVFSPLAPPCKHNCKAGVPARYRDYLAVTSDGGQTWRTTGKLPANFNPGATYALQLAFKNPDEGYVQSTDPAETLFTDNAGRTWSALRISGWPTALSLAGSSLWIVSQFCPASLLPPDGLCPSSAAHLPARAPDTRQRDAYPDRRYSRLERNLRKHTCRHAVRPSRTSFWRCRGGR